LLYPALLALPALLCSATSSCTRPGQSTRALPVSLPVGYLELPAYYLTSHTLPCLLLMPPEYRRLCYATSPRSTSPFVSLCSDLSRLHWLDHCAPSPSSSTSHSLFPTLVRIVPTSLYLCFCRPVRGQPHASLPLTCRPPNLPLLCSRRTRLLQANVIPSQCNSLHHQSAPHRTAPHRSLPTITTTSSLEPPSSSYTALSETDPPYLHVSRPRSTLPAPLSLLHPSITLGPRRCYFNYLTLPSCPSRPLKLFFLLIHLHLLVASFLTLTPADSGDTYRPVSSTSFTTPIYYAYHPTVFAHIPHSHERRILWEPSPNSGDQGCAPGSAMKRDSRCKEGSLGDCVTRP
jgi:hypothetical protein